MPCCAHGRIGRPLVSIRSLVSFLLLILIGSASPALAQSISGRVTDPDDRPVASAQVIVMLGTTVVATERTRLDGRYGPLALPTGTYDLIVSAPGLRATPRAVSVGSTAATADVPLRLSAVTESVVVSASHTETPLTRATDSVTVIGREDLDVLQTETVADALRLAPGFGVVASGGRGGITSVFPRGGESDYTQFLADGVPLNSFGGGFDAAHLPTADLDRIEIVRGPQSALYGSGAIGGVVQLITRHGGPLTGRALFETGGYGTRRASVSGAGSYGQLTWGGAFERLDSDGDQRDYPEYGGRIVNDDYERWDLSGSAGWANGPGRRARVTFRHGENYRGFPGPYGSDPDGLYDGINDGSNGENRNTTVSVSGIAGDVTSLRHSGLVTHFDTTGDFASKFGEFVSESESASRRTTGRYQADMERLGVGLSAGLEYLVERAESTYILNSGAMPIPVERTNTGLFVESRWRLGERGALTAGLRAERIARRALAGDPAQFTERPDFDEDVTWSMNPKVAGTWLLNAPDALSSPHWTRLRASAGTGIKAPNAFDIAFTDNPNLKPERSRSVDVGIEQALAGSSLLIDATWFANRYDDLLVSVGTSLSGASRFRTDNIANASARGLELGVVWQGPQGVRLRGAMTFLDTEVLDVDDVPGGAPRPFSVGDALLRRAPRQGSIEARWSSARGSVFAVVNGRSEMLDLEPNFASSLYDNPGHVATTVGGAWAILRSVEVFGRVANLFDREYEDVFGYPAAGRVAFVGLRVAARR